MMYILPMTKSVHNGIPRLLQSRALLNLVSQSQTLTQRRVWSTYVDLFILTPTKSGWAIISCEVIFLISCHACTRSHRNGDVSIYSVQLFQFLLCFLVRDASFAQAAILTNHAPGYKQKKLYEINGDVTVPACPSACMTAIKEDHFAANYHPPRFGGCQNKVWLHEAMLVISFCGA